MHRKIIYISASILAAIQILLLITSSFISKTHKKEIEFYAIKKVESSYHKLRGSMSKNSLLKIGDDYLKEHNPEYSIKINQADSMALSFIFLLKNGESKTYIDSIREYSLEEQQKMKQITSFRDFNNLNFIKQYFALTYLEACREVPKEIRRFLIVNILLLALIGFSAWYSKKSNIAITLPLYLLLASTILALYLFVFQTNWFIKIIVGSYQGYSYIGLVFLIFITLQFTTWLPSSKNTIFR